MKKTLNKKKLQLSKQTVRELSRADLTNANGGWSIVTTTCPPPTNGACHSVQDSCYKTDCCLIEP